MKENKYNFKSNSMMNANTISGNNLRNSPTINQKEKVSCNSHILGRRNYEYENNELNNQFNQSQMNSQSFPVNTNTNNFENYEVINSSTGFGNKLLDSNLGGNYLNCNPQPSNKDFYNSYQSFSPSQINEEDEQPREYTLGNEKEDKLKEREKNIRKVNMTYNPTYNNYKQETEEQLFHKRINQQNPKSLNDFNSNKLPITSISSIKNIYSNNNSNMTYRAEIRQVEKEEREGGVNTNKASKNNKTSEEYIKKLEFQVKNQAIRLGKLEKTKFELERELLNTNSLNSNEKKQKIDTHKFKNLKSALENSIKTEFSNKNLTFIDYKENLLELETRISMEPVNNNFVNKILLL